MSTGSSADALSSADKRSGSGVRLGKYELVRRLAVGGMAEIFLARTTAMHGFEKLVVLKRILPQHAENEEFIQMFLDEARLAATLAHPNIVQVYDIGAHDGQYFFSMEYVEGQDLRSIVKAARRGAGGVPLEHVINIIVGTAAGLHYAHEQTDNSGQLMGIVHRDVSPSNVLVTYTGGIKLVDFGIAKASTAQVNTVAGTLKGKIPYMSPEQCRGEKLDRRSDIFSIGTLLWELSTSSRLFRGENEFATLNRIANGEVPLPSTRVEGYPEELERIVMKALQRYPDDRYDTAQELQVDLEDFARESKLAVSSSRLAAYMRALFEEEIQRQKTLTAVDVSKLAHTTQALEDGDVEEVREWVAGQAREDETAAYTPSELGIKVPSTPAPGTDVTYVGGAAEAEDDLDLMPQPKPWGKLAAAAAGALLLIGGVVAVAGGDDEPEPAKTKAKPAEVAPKVITPTVPPPEPEPEPVAQPEPPPPEPAPTPKATKKTKKTTAKKKSSKAGSKSKTRPKRKKKKKKKKAWDPNSPLPPPG